MRRAKAVVRALSRNTSEDVMSWRDELRDAIAKDDAALAQKQELREDKDRRLQANRQTARDVFEREIVPGINDVVEELGGDARKAQVVPSLDVTSPRVSVHLPRPGRDDLRLQIIAEVTAEGVAVQMKDEGTGNMPLAFPRDADTVTRETVAEAVATAYRESLTRKSERRSQ